MTKQEAVNIMSYLYHEEVRLQQAVSDCSMRYVRRELDSIDLLEEIIAKENLKYFHGIEADIYRILQLSTEDLEAYLKKKFQM